MFRPILQATSTPFDFMPTVQLKPKPRKLTRAERARRDYDRWYRREKGEASGAFVNGRFLCAIRTMEETAEILGCSRQAVHQVERRALKKIRAALEPLRVELLAKA